MEIERRIKGTENFVKGSKASDIELKDTDGKLFDLYNFNPSGPNILLIFWSADCSHCTETVDAISLWLKQAENQQQLSVIAISLDETETEIKAWEKIKGELKGWKHLRAADGVRSKVANDYYILATPVMIVLNTKTKEIIAMPNNLSELMDALK